MRTGRLTSTAGLLCVVVPLVGVISALFLELVPPQVAPTTYSYPLATGDFAIMQGFLALLALAIATGMLGVRWSGAAPGRVGLIVACCSAAGFVLLAALEALRIVFAGVKMNSPQAAALSGSALVIETATAAAVIALGCVVLIHRKWTGWRAWLPLATGITLLAVPVLGLLGVSTVTRGATAVWLILSVLLGLTVNRAGNRAMAAAGVKRVRRPGAITIAALLFWFNAASFGIPSVAALASVLAGGGLPRLFGFESFGGGPFDRLGTTGLAVLLGLFVVVCLAEVIAGALLWQDRRSGRILALALLPVGAVLWWGFAVPLPALNGLVRTALVLVGWTQKTEPHGDASKAEIDGRRAVGKYGAMTTRDGSVGLVSVAPVFSTTNVEAWLDHYRGLGFTVEAHDDDYGFAVMGPIQLHVSRNPDHDPLTTAGCAYLYVHDADAVWRRWSTVAGGRSVQPVDTDYGLREGAHTDPDGNLLRYGSAL